MRIGSLFPFQKKRCHEAIKKHNAIKSPLSSFCGRRFDIFIFIINLFSRFQQLFLFSNDDDDDNCSNINA